VRRRLVAPLGARLHRREAPPADSTFVAGPAVVVVWVAGDSLR
jgi:hypothetical protein